MTPGELTLRPVVSGDTWNGINQIQVYVNNAAPANTLAAVVMEFRPKSAPSRLELLLDTDDDTIVINDAANWQISIPAMIMTLNPGVYLWNLETTDSAGTVKTYIKGTIEVLRA